MDRRKIRKLYITENLSAEDVGKRLGVSRRTISRYLKSAGIKKDSSVDVNKITEMYLSGLMAKEIAKQLGMKTQSVQYYLRTADVRKRKKINTEDLAELYKNGMTAKEVGDKFGISEDAVRERFKKFNRENENKINKHKRHTLDHNSFSKFTPESCYWAGFLASDGWVYAKQRKVCVELKASDSGHLKKLCSFVGRDSGLYYRTRRQYGKSYDCASLMLTSQKMIDDLCDNFNIVPNKSLTLKPPRNIPKHFRKHFVRGYVDGDGCITWRKDRNHYMVGICSGSLQVLEWIKDVISSEVKDSGAPNVNHRKNRKLFTLEYGGRIQSENVLNWLYSSSKNNIRLQRKYEKYSKTR